AINHPAESETDGITGNLLQKSGFFQSFAQNLAIAEPHLA
ncbi:MAG: hypothetical protein UW55_C0048G0001, partial [Candidatus Giovannonibacteria bacterium GW2011_GWA2_44_26]